MTFTQQISFLANHLNATYTVAQLREQWVAYAERLENLTHSCKEMAYIHDVPQPTTGGEWISLAHYVQCDDEWNNQEAMERERDEWVNHWDD